MTDTLLWSLDETARQLGGISIRTVRRMLKRGDLKPVRIGRSLRVCANSVHSFVDRSRTKSDNPCGVAVLGENTCHEKRSETKTESTSGRTHRTGGQRSRTAAADQLGALLAFPSQTTPKD